MVIVCGWCGKPTTNCDRCSTCGHEDPARPWVQRGDQPPTWAKADEHRQKISAARKQLEQAGQKVTVAALAELCSVDDRTIRRWMSE